MRLNSDVIGVHVFLISAVIGFVRNFWGKEAEKNYAHWQYWSKRFPRLLPPRDKSEMTATNDKTYTLLLIIAVVVYIYVMFGQQ